MLLFPGDNSYFSLPKISELNMDGISAEKLKQFVVVQSENTKALCVNGYESVKSVGVNLKVIFVDMWRIYFDK